MPSNKKNKNKQNKGDRILSKPEEKQLVKELFEGIGISFAPIHEKLIKIRDLLEEKYLFIENSTKIYKKLCLEKKQKLEYIVKDETSPPISNDDKLVEELNSFFEKIKKEKDEIQENILADKPKYDALGKLAHTLTLKFYEEVYEKFRAFLNENETGIEFNSLLPSIMDYMRVNLRHITLVIDKYMNDRHRLIKLFNIYEKEYDASKIDIEYHTKKKYNYLLFKKAKNNVEEVFKNITLKIEKINSSSSEDILIMTEKNKAAGVHVFQANNRTVLKEIDNLSIELIVKLFKKILQIELLDTDTISHELETYYKAMLKSLLINKVNFYDKMTKIFSDYENNKDFNNFVRQYMSLLNEKKSCHKLRNDLKELVIFENDKAKDFLESIFLQALGDPAINHFENLYKKVLCNEVENQIKLLNYFLDRLTLKVEEINKNIASNKDINYKKNQDQHLLSHDKIIKLKNELIDLSKLADLETKLNKLRDFAVKSEKVKSDLKAQLRIIETHDDEGSDSNHSENLESDKEEKLIPKILLEAVHDINDSFLEHILDSINKIRQQTGKDYKAITKELTPILNTLGWSNELKGSGGSHSKLKFTKDFGEGVGIKSVVFPLWQKLDKDPLNDDFKYYLQNTLSLLGFNKERIEDFLESLKPKSPRPK